MTSHYPCNDNSVPALAEKNATRNVIVFDCEEWGIFYQQCSTVQVLEQGFTLQEHSVSSM